ncbi:DoxX family membrane protein [Seongchinamella sediminis]|uniref:DoxX family membrane protein n=2 Tax=Seongchinamella sediminis TaxID=2283635 RepID=A0A3L7E459_9GAMM|nr:DoxX family membrane protein [Seongchinamella sediminis]
MTQSTTGTFAPAQASTATRSGLAARLLRTSAGWDALALRIPAGIIFAAHGAQKLFGWFGGHGLAGTGQWLESIGLAPGYLMALLAGGAEFLGGLALLVGLLVRPAAVVLAFTMLVAIFTVHIGNGLFMSNNGYEFGLALLAISVSLAVSGAGRASFDRLLSGKGA